MTTRGKRPKNKELDYGLEKLVLILLVAPTFPWLLATFGLDEYPHGSELPGLALLAVLLWAAATAITLGAGSARALFELIAFSLACLPLIGWFFVLLEPDPGPRGGDLVSALSVTGAGLAAALFVARWKGMWPFADARGPDKNSDHECAVVFADPEGIEPYYVPICDCGWMGDFVSASELAFHEARTHTSNVKPDVERPLEDGPTG